jgi:hypothetical protein
MYEAVFLLAVVLVLWLGLDGAFLRVLCLAALLIEGIWWLNWELSSKAEGGPAGGISGFNFSERESCFAAEACLKPTCMGIVFYQHRMLIYLGYGGEKMYFTESRPIVITVVGAIFSCRGQ